MTLSHDNRRTKDASSVILAGAIASAVGCSDEANGVAERAGRDAGSGGTPNDQDAGSAPDSGRTTGGQDAGGAPDGGATTISNDASGDGGGPPDAGRSRPRVTLSDGQLVGEVAGRTRRFLGIPFGAPPTGDLRWRPPAPVVPWEGTRDASEPKPACVQFGTGFLGRAQ